MTNRESEEPGQAAEAEATRSAESANAATEPNSVLPDIDEVIARLDTSFGNLPENAIRDARRLRPQIIPPLIELIRKAAETARDQKEVATNGHFFALYLLAEFRAKEALPVILDALRANDEADNDLFGDAITEDLSPMFAVLAVDDQDALAKLIDDKTVNKWVRWAALGTYLYWVRDGVLARDTAVERLRQHLAHAVREVDAEIITPLLYSLGDFGAKEAEPEIQQVFDRYLVNTGEVNRKQLKDDLEEGKERLQRGLERCPPSGIPDAIAELSRWASFEEEPHSG